MTYIETNKTYQLQQLVMPSKQPMDRSHGECSTELIGASVIFRWHDFVFAAMWEDSEVTVIDLTGVGTPEHIAKQVSAAALPISELERVVLRYEPSKSGHERVIAARYKLTHLAQLASSGLSTALIELIKTYTSLSTVDHVLFPSHDEYDLLCAYNTENERSVIVQMPPAFYGHAQKGFMHVSDGLKPLHITKSRTPDGKGRDLRDVEAYPTGVAGRRVEEEEFKKYPLFFEATSDAIKSANLLLTYAKRIARTARELDMPSTPDTKDIRASLTVNPDASKLQEKFEKASGDPAWVKPSLAGRATWGATNQINADPNSIKEEKRDVNIMTTVEELLKAINNIKDKEAATMAPQDNKVSTMDRFIGNPRQELNAAVWRVAAANVLELVREPLYNALAEQLGVEKNKPLKQRMVKFLDSDIGQAFMSFGVALSLPAVGYMLPEDIRAYTERMATELRLLGYDKAMRPLAKLITGPVRKALTEALQNVLSQPAIRVKLDEDTKSAVPEEVVASANVTNGNHKTA